MKILEKFGVPRNKIIDGRVFRVPNLDFRRLLNEGIAYGKSESNSIDYIPPVIYPKFCQVEKNGAIIKLGRKSYTGKIKVELGGLISVGAFTSISWNIDFQIRMNGFHNPRNISSYSSDNLDWYAGKEFFPNLGLCKIDIGNDVWICQNSIIKSSNPEKPLIIGDGAVVAADSVVVKNVPPYAIVGGNPARIIKYRFSEDIIEALLRIKWWNWDIDKIYENYKYFNRIEEFVAIHDKGV